MSNKTEAKLDILTKHRHLLVRVFVGLYITAAILLVWLTVILSVPEGIDEKGQLATAGVSFEAPQEQAVSENEVLSLSPSEPVLLRVPSVNLVAEFENPLGLNEDGTVQVPESFNKVARYKYTPTPGETGPSVILGHVDSLDGPAVFHPLIQIRKGEIIEITREDGTIVIFEVYETEVVKQDNFPNTKVYESVPNAEIRLITCTGVYDRNIRRYSHNLIVYGEFKQIEIPRNSIKDIEA